MNKKIKQYIAKYHETLPISKRNQHLIVDSFYFCADKKSANICSELVSKGIKTATCSMKYWYEHDNEPMPVVGQLFVITDWDGEPTSIIEIISVAQSRYCDIDKEFACAEGEGDKTLEYWRKVHWGFFSKECEGLGIEFTEDMLLILEKFKVVYK